MLWCFLVVFCFFFFLVTSRISAPQQKIEPVPPALEGKVLTTGPPGKSPLSSFLKLKLIQSIIYKTGVVTTAKVLVYKLI